MPFDHFDLIASAYDRLPPFEPGSELLAGLALPIRGLLLDAAGGTGRVAAALRDWTGGAIVADLSPGMLRRAHKRALPALRAPVERLPFADGAFERIVMVDAWHHVADQAETGRELWRMVSPGGRVVILDPDIRRFTVRLVALAERLLLMRSRFQAAEAIAASFAARGARVSVRREASSIIVIAEK
jgi:demethylmenaquinone methyltransferase/2-methoxy-6-polyprenyl-1,4-benzoquinol methylase